MNFLFLCALCSASIIELNKSLSEALHRNIDYRIFTSFFNQVLDQLENSSADADSAKLKENFQSLSIKAYSSLKDGIQPLLRFCIFELEADIKRLGQTLIASREAKYDVTKGETTLHAMESAVAQFKGLLQIDNDKEVAQLMIYVIMHRITLNKTMRNINEMIQSQNLKLRPFDFNTLKSLSQRIVEVLNQSYEKDFDASSFSDVVKDVSLLAHRLSAYGRIAEKNDLINLFSSLELSLKPRLPGVYATVLAEKKDHILKLIYELQRDLPQLPDYYSTIDELEKISVATRNAGDIFEILDYEMTLEIYRMFM